MTGAANGLGAAMTEGLLEAGAQVMLADIAEDALADIATRLSNRFGASRVRASCVDVTRDTELESLVPATIDAFGSVDVVINNAGTGAQIVRPDFISRPLRSWEVPPDKWRRIVEVNAIATFVLSRAAIPAMVAQGFGRLINLTTAWETMLRAGFASYGPSKAMIEAMSAAMASELEATGVTVNTIHPGGPVDTAQVPPDIGVARDKLLRPAVMVPLVQWLASDAADAVTGRRLTAAAWRSDRSDAENLDKASEPAAWPQLVKPIVMADRGNL
ncbi:MAG: SDR family NAD(P)-dependent oxidoreductase [Lautropia sp.]